MYLLFTNPILCNTDNRKKLTEIYVAGRELTNKESNVICDRFGYMSYDIEGAYLPILLDQAEIATRFPHRYQDSDGNWWSSAAQFPVVTIDNQGVYSEEFIEYYFGEFAYQENKNYIRVDNLEYHDEPSEYHSQKPLWRSGSFKGKLIGIEMEVDTKGEDEILELTEYINTLTKDYVIIEDDGSLGDYGVEIIFRPLTLEEVNNGQLEKAFRKIASKCESNRQPKTYGMHCNLSKEWFSGELHELKFAHIMNNAYPLTKKIANRESSNYAKLNQGSIMDKKKTDRYAMVNLTHKKRLEVRIFRASLHWGRFSLQIQYCMALIEFSKNASIQDLNETMFLKWLGNQKHRKDYKLLGWFCLPDVYSPIKNMHKFWN